MKRLVAIVLVSGMLAGCGARDESVPEVSAASDAASAESDNGAADMPAPPTAPGQGAPSPEPMNAPPAESDAQAADSVDRGLPVCPGDPRCKRK